MANPAETLTAPRNRGVFPTRPLYHEPPRVARSGERVQVLHVGNIEARKFDVEFSHVVSRDVAVRGVFIKGRVPAGFAIEPYPRNGHLWTVSRDRPGFGGLGQYLNPKLYLLLEARTGNPPPPRTFEEFKATRTSTGATIGALLKLGYGAHEVNGYFVWIGQVGLELQVQMQRYFAEPRYRAVNSDVRYFLERDKSLREALDYTSESWGQVARMAIYAFASVLSDAAGVVPGRRSVPSPTRGLTRFERELEQIASRPKTPVKRSVIVEALTSEEALQTATTALSAVPAIKKAVEHLRDDTEDAVSEITATVNEDAERLHSAASAYSAGIAAVVGAVSPPKIPTGLIGDVGEKFIRDLLASRGYVDIVSLQNNSGHGIDVIASKCWGNGAARRCIIVYFEVKATTTGRPGTLSRAQRNGVKFVLERLALIAKRRGRFRDMPAADVRRARQLLALHLEHGVPVGGVVADITVSRGWKFYGFALVAQLRRWVRATLARSHK